jgi:hypothetical protein
MQVVAVSISNSQDWRWRIVNYAGETIEESRETFGSIARAVAAGKTRLVAMDVVDRSTPNYGHRTTSHLRGR